MVHRDLRGLVEENWSPFSYMPEALHMLSEVPQSWNKSRSKDIFTRKKRLLSRLSDI